MHVWGVSKVFTAAQRTSCHTPPRGLDDVGSDGDDGAKTLLWNSACAASTARALIPELSHPGDGTRT